LRGSIPRCSRTIVVAGSVVDERHVVLAEHLEQRGASQDHDASLIRIVQEAA